jgi:hypothetical protein
LVRFKFKDEIMGEARLALVLPSLPPELWVFERTFTKNLRLYGAETIISQLLRDDPTGKDWRLSTAYIEFENNSGAAVSTPTPTRDEGLEYYLGLSSDPKRDYLRVPVISTILESSDSDLYPGGNQTRYLVHTSGVTGVNGKSFSSGSQSRVYGAALVATPVSGDHTQDVVYSRVYFSSGNQSIKTATTQIAMEYRDTRE